MMTAVFSVSLAASGFEAILNVPIGLSVGFHNYKLTKYGESIKQYIEPSAKQNSGVGFDIGVSVSIRLYDSSEERFWN